MGSRIMTVPVFITIDTELSLALHQTGMSAEDNLKSSVFGECGDGAFGIAHQMDRLEEHGLKAVFFVDPMPALAYGKAIIANIVEPIMKRGHDVQLHIHTEWLEFIESQPVGSLRGRNIGDFPLEAQCKLLSLARDLLVQAGARPMAFRAGNYGANDDSLRALKTIGLRYDSSFNPAYIGAGCNIVLSSAVSGPTEHLGIVELPISTIYDRKNHLRHAQICALSSREMRAALGHAAAQDAAMFNIVTHSFELLSRDRERPNQLVISRFEQLCKNIAEHSDLASATFADIGDIALNLDRCQQTPRLPPNMLRTAMRMVEQASAQLKYERG